MAAKRTKKPDRISPIGERLLPLEKPDNIRRMIVALAIFCGLLFLADFVIHRHGHFPVENLPGFYGIYGFCAFTFIIFAVKLLRRLLWRPENYYGNKAVNSEKYPPEGLDVKEYGDA